MKLGLGVAMVGAVLGATALGARHLGVLDETPPGFRVGGRVVDPRLPIGVWLDQQRVRRAGEEVTLATGEGFHRVAMGELGVEVDVSSTLQRVRQRLDEAAGPRAWWGLASAARQGEIDVPLVYRIDAGKARAALEPLAPEVHRAPQNARLDLMGHARIPDLPGIDLDVDATTARLLDEAAEPGALLSVSTRATPAPFTLAHLADIDVSKVLATAETSFSLAGTGAGRAVNIATAARRLDGWVIGPGEAFSFNKVVGPRSLEAGFTYAPEIVDEELEMGVGGGTCQVSSTLHTAAVLGALDVTERIGHSRPSSYAKLGLDATVIYGQVDLKLRNPFPFPLIVHAFLPSKTTLRIELLGAEPQAKVAYSFGINKEEDFYRRITYKPTLPPGKVHLHQKGIRGREVVSRVTTSWFDGRVTERTYLSGYRPVPEVFWVGRDVDETQLPELPEGVTRVQRRNFKSSPPEAHSEAGGQPTSG